MQTIFYRTILFSAAVFLFTASYAQLGIGTNPPDNNAMLDIQSGGKGVLLPRLSLVQQNALTSMLGPTQAGMLFMDAATGKLLSWNGTAWRDVTGNTTIGGTSPLSVSATNIASLNPGTAAGDLITWDGANWVNKQPAKNFTITKDNRQPFLALNYCIALQGIFPSQNEPFLAEIDLYSFSFPPKGFAFCNGQILPISQNQALFSLLGTTYGGNGVNNFALPNLQGRIPIHSGTGPTLSAYTLGQTGGSEQSILSH